MKKKQPQSNKASQWAALAKAEGLSYGNWVAKYHPPGAPAEPSGRTKVCPHCGKYFTTNYSNKIYCTPECTYLAREKRKQEQRRRRKEQEKLCSTKS